MADPIKPAASGVRPAASAGAAPESTQARPSQPIDRYIPAGPGDAAPPQPPVDPRVDSDTLKAAKNAIIKTYDDKSAENDRRFIEGWGKDFVGDYVFGRDRQGLTKEENDTLNAIIAKLAAVTEPVDEEVTVRRGGRNVRETVTRQVAIGENKAKDWLESDVTNFTDDLTTAELVLLSKALQVWSNSAGGEARFEKNVKMNLEIFLKTNAGSGSLQALIACGRDAKQCKDGAEVSDDVGAFWDKLVKDNKLISLRKGVQDKTATQADYDTAVANVTDAIVKYARGGSRSMSDTSGDPTKPTDAVEAASRYAAKENEALKPLADAMGKSVADVRAAYKEWLDEFAEEKNDDVRLKLVQDMVKAKVKEAAAAKVKADEAASRAAAKATEDTKKASENSKIANLKINVRATAEAVAVKRGWVTKDELKQVDAKKKVEDAIKIVMSEMVIPSAVEKGLITDDEVGLAKIASATLFDKKAKIKFSIEDPADQKQASDAFQKVLAFTSGILKEMDEAIAGNAGVDVLAQQEALLNRMYHEAVDGSLDKEFNAIKKSNGTIIAAVGGAFGASGVQKSDVDLDKKPQGDPQEGQLTGLLLFMYEGNVLNLYDYASRIRKVANATDLSLAGSALMVAGSASATGMDLHPLFLKLEDKPGQAGLAFNDMSLRLTHTRKAAVRNDKGEVEKDGKDDVMYTSAELFIKGGIVDDDFRDMIFGVPGLGNTNYMKYSPVYKTRVGTYGQASVAVGQNVVVMGGVEAGVPVDDFAMGSSPVLANRKDDGSRLWETEWRLGAYYTNNPASPAEGILAGAAAQALISEKNSYGAYLFGQVPVMKGHTAAAYANAYSLNDGNDFQGSFGASYAWLINKDHSIVGALNWASKSAGIEYGNAGSGISVTGDALDSAGVFKQDREQTAKHVGVRYKVKTDLGSLAFDGRLVHIDNSIGDFSTDGWQPMLGMSLTGKF